MQKPPVIGYSKQENDIVGMRDNRYAIIFPGQGSQFVGMGKELLESSADAQRLFALAEDITGIPLRKLCAEGPEDELALTLNSQVAIFTLEAALCDLFRSAAAHPPALLAGHSLGEYAALYYSRIFTDAADAIRLVHCRAKRHHETISVGKGGMMAVVGAELFALERACSDISKSDFVAEIANINSNNQVVISGHREALIAVAERIKAVSRARAILLPISVPCHSSLMKEASALLAADIAAIKINDPEITVLANYSPATPHSKATTKEMLAKQLVSPVRWLECVEAMINAKMSAVIEIGAKSVLLPLLAKASPKTDTIFVSDVPSLKEAFKKINLKTS